MKKPLLIFFIQLLIISSVSAQFFSGYFVSDPPQEEFEHLKIHHHHSKHHKYEGDLSVKAFLEFGELWELKANMIDGEKANFFVERFGRGKEIQTVYEIKIQLDGVEEDFILMGYEGENHHPAFIAIEELFENEKEEELIDVKSFRLVKAHHLN
ncbi:MAG: hypothetical protein JXR03_01690 [Cyclobacteriaceae bacterium]